MLQRFAIFNDDRLVHAITTRDGGVSDPPFASLNMSFSRPDHPAHVRENRQRVYRALEIEPARVVQAAQVHGADVRLVDEADAGRGALDRSMIVPAADALITNTPNLYLLACFADCVPLLFFDPVRGAVGVAHAGTQGTVKRIGAATVRALHEHYGTQPGDLCVVIGPSAGACCYNVWPHIADEIRAAFPDRPDLLIQRGDQQFFDLWTANTHTLTEAGVPPSQIEVSAVCTIHNADRYFSHRASGGNTGRIAAIIGLRDWS